MNLTALTPFAQLLLVIFAQPLGYALSDHIKILPLLILKLFGFTCVVLRSKRDQRYLRSRVKFNYLMQSFEDRPQGLFWSLDPFVMCYSDSLNLYLYMVARTKNINNLLDRYVGKKAYKYIEINGPISDRIYRTQYLQLDPNLETPWKNQSSAIDKIIKLYGNNGHHCSIFLYGNTMCGKSSVPYFLIPHFKSPFVCDSFNPTQPNNSFSDIYCNFSPTVEEPIIVILDEVDIILNKLHDQKVHENQKFATDVTDKIGWTSLMDKFGRGMFKNVILIMTSNRTKEELDALDPAYLRSGRVDISIDMSLEKNSVTA